MGTMGGVRLVMGETKDYGGRAQGYIRPPAEAGAQGVSRAQFCVLGLPQGFRFPRELRILHPNSSWRFGAELVVGRRGSPVFELRVVWPVRATMLVLHE